MGLLPGIHVYLNDLPIATRGSAERHWLELQKRLQVLNEKKAAVKRNICIIFAKLIKWLDFKLSNRGTVPVETKLSRY